jgi:hypothetical protein
MSQTNGSTPLLVASQFGHVECVRALLGGGAAINQAMVGCARSMARHCGGYSRGDPWEHSRMHVQLAGCLHTARWRAWARGDPAHGTLDGVGNLVIIGCGTRGTEVVRRGVMRGLFVPCGVADGRGHASVYRLPGGKSGVRAGVVGRLCGDQPGEGGLCKLDGSALRGLFPRGCLGALPHACAVGGVVALRVVEGLGQEVVQPMFQLTGWGASL